MEKFSNTRVKNGASTCFHQNVKKWFEIENELCDWIINLWQYSKNLDDEILEMYAFVNLELIKDYWDNENFINCEFLIDQLLKNDSSFFNFEVFVQAKNFCLSKFMIYNLIRKPEKTPSKSKKIRPFFNF